MAHRLTTPFVQMRTNLGAIAASGTLTFYEANSETLATVYTDEALSDEANNPITLDSAGYAATEVWSGEVVDVVLKNSLGTVQKTVLAVQAPASEVDALPAGTDGQVLIINGTTPEFADFVPLPDQTGNIGRFLKTDGEAPYWAAADAETVYDSDNLPGGLEEVTPGEDIVFGNTRIMAGSGVIPTAGDIFSQVAVSFGAGKFSSAPKVTCTATDSEVTGQGDDANISAISKTANGFTARAFCGAENLGGDIEIESQIGFDWIAMGPK